MCIDKCLPVIIHCLQLIQFNSRPCIFWFLSWISRNCWYICFWIGELCRRLFAQNLVCKKELRMLVFSSIMCLSLRCCLTWVSTAFSVSWKIGVLPSSEKLGECSKIEMSVAQKGRYKDKLKGCHKGWALWCCLAHIHYCQSLLFSKPDLYPSHLHIFKMQNAYLKTLVYSTLSLKTLFYLLNLYTSCFKSMPLDLKKIVLLLKGCSPRQTILWLNRLEQ